jgi:hypothetical protein
MMRILLLIPVLVCCLVFNAAAQELCGTDQLHAMRMKTDSAYRNYMTAYNARLRAAVQNPDNQSSPGRSVTYILPVVVHVIHTGQPIGTGSNISDAQIQGAINGINARWGNANGMGADLEVAFCLANTNPSGGFSTGINRVNGAAVPGYLSSGVNWFSTSTCGGADPEAIKDLSRWPVTDYYNIWIVPSICEGWGGYASYPYGGIYDGAVIVAQYFSASYAAAAHELGHAFNLKHTFEGDGGDLTCPDDFDCSTDGDEVCDTKPHRQSDCGTTSTCPGSGTWDNSRFNYMSYCPTSDRFTTGQRNRVYATLQVFPRSELLLNNICLGSGINDHADDASVSIYPNPVTSELSIDNSELKIKEIEMYTALGEKVCERTLASGTRLSTISVTDFPSGIYFITVTDNKGNKVTKKVVKM